MLDKYNLFNILFLDIETVPLKPSFNELPEKFKYFWEKKSESFRSEEESAEDVYSRAGIYSEFGKIVCISVGILKKGTVSQYGFRVKSFYGTDEKELLRGFSEMVQNFSSKEDARLCAHNGKEFDFPYIARRMLINGIPVPEILNVPGKKPWEVPFIDTMELWKFGDRKNFTSLDLLAYIFEIPTPKNDIDGSMVGKVFWEDNDVERIAQYCEKDALAVAQLFLRFRGENLVEEQDVEHAKS